MMEVYKAISGVQADLAKTGISKDRTNSQPGANYKFRGIDDVYNVLGPMLSKHGLCILPRMLSRDVVERRSAKGNALFYVTLEAEFDFVAVSDGSKHTVRTFGEAMDSGDKATNKAMSAAYKYAAFQAFAIPTEGDNDADATTHEVASDRPRTPANDRNGNSEKAAREKLAGPYTSKTALWQAVKQFDRELRSCGDADQLDALLMSDDARALLAQVQRDAPQLAQGGEGLPVEFEPLAKLIGRLKEELAGDTSEWRSNPLSAG